MRSSLYGSEITYLRVHLLHTGMISNRICFRHGFLLSLRFCLPFLRLLILFVIRIFQCISPWRCRAWPLDYRSHRYHSRLFRDKQSLSQQGFAIKASILPVQNDGCAGAILHDDTAVKYPEDELHNESNRLLSNRRYDTRTTLISQIQWDK